VADWTVERIIRGPMEFRVAKHELRDDVDEQINAMSNVELLRAISDAIEQRLAQEKNDV